MKNNERNIEVRKALKWIFLFFLFFLLLDYLSRVFLHDNLEIVLMNETQNSEVKVRVWLDDDIVFDDTVMTCAPSFIPLHKKIGYHTVEIYRFDNEETKIDKIHLVFLKWVDFHLKVKPDTVVKKEYIIPHSYF